MTTLYHQRRVTLAEALIMVGIVGGFFAIVGIGARACLSGPEMKRAAEKEARAWARDLGLDVAGISCADLDTDGDGYVSCTVRLSGEGQHTHQVECRGAWSSGHGCRDPKLRLPRER